MINIIIKDIKQQVRIKHNKETLFEIQGSQEEFEELQVYVTHYIEFLEEYNIICNDHDIHIPYVYLQHRLNEIATSLVVTFEELVFLNLCCNYETGLIKEYELLKWNNNHMFYYMDEFEQ